MGAGAALADSLKGEGRQIGQQRLAPWTGLPNWTFFLLIEGVRRQPARDHDAEARQLLGVLK